MTPPRTSSQSYERLPRAAELFLERGGGEDLRHALIVVRLGPPDPAAPGPLTAAGLAAQAASRIHLLPARFRRVIRHTPLRLGRPILVDDPGFDISRHVRELAAPAPLSDAGLARLVDEYAASPLDPARPLWEIGVTPELDDGGRAIVLKMHHAVVEGEGGVANAALLVFDAAPDPEPMPPQDWEAAPAPSSEVRLALADQRRRFAVAVRRLPRSAADLAASARRLRDAVRAWRTEIEARRAQPRFRPPIDRHATAFAVTPAAEVEVIRAAAGEGATFNDVFIAGVAGGIGRWQAEVGIEAADLVAAVPVSLSRAEGERPSEFTEMPSIMFVPLPATEPDPAERLRRVRAATAHGKRVAPELAVVASALTALPAGLYQRLATRFYNHAEDFYLTNIQGPDMDLYVLGHPVSYAYITGRTRSPLRMAALTFAGALTVGIACDPGRVPRPDLLARAIEKEFAALAATAAAADPGSARRSRS